MTDLNPSSSSISQTYCFRLISDNEQFQTTFRGNISMDDVRNILNALQNHLYADSGKIIGGYLMQHPLEYSNLHFEASKADHQEIMACADILLHSGSVHPIDMVIGGADNYYVIIDHQVFFDGNTCEGCCFAVKKTTSECNGQSICSIIGQSFTSNVSDTDPLGFFAIRSSKGSSQFHNILRVPQPVILTFGCIDLIGLLLDIEHIRTAQQAFQAATR